MVLSAFGVSNYIQVSQVTFTDTNIALGNDSNGLNINFLISSDMNGIMPFNISPNAIERASIEILMLNTATEEYSCGSVEGVCYLEHNGSYEATG